MRPMQKHDNEKMKRYFFEIIAFRKFYTCSFWLKWCESNESYDQMSRECFE